MGERHLVYVRVDNSLFQEHYAHRLDDLYYNRNLTGLHIQWLLGHSAVNCLVNMLNFHSKNVSVIEGKPISLSPFQVMASDLSDRGDRQQQYTQAERALQSLYRVCPITGFWTTGVKILDKDRLFYADNNTGITVVDFADCLHPKYCFLNPNTPFVTQPLKAFPACVPLDAATYLTAFGEVPKNWEQGHLERLLARLSAFPVLTREELYQIFLPQAYLATASPPELPGFLGELPDRDVP